MSNIHVVAGLKTLAFIAFVAVTSVGTVFLLDTFRDVIHPMMVVAGVVLTFCVYTVYNIILAQEKFKHKFKKAE
jgi:hypothetical protein